MSLQHKIPHQPGIYGIINQLTKKFYIGQTTNLYNAYKNHARAFANNGNSGNRYLVKDVIKYGKENFVFQIFEIIPSEEIVDNQYLNDLKDIYLTCVDFGVYNHSHRKRLKAKGIHFTFDQETGLYSWSRNPDTENTKKVNPDQIPSQLEKQKKLELPITPEAREKLVNSLQTSKGGWTRKDLEIIGVDWPPPSGWKAAFIKYGENWKNFL